MPSGAGQKKKRKLAEKAAAAQPVPEKIDDDEGEEEVEEEEEDDDDDDDEALDLGTADASDPLPMDFGFYDPKAEDFHGMRALLANTSSLMPTGSSWDVGGLADVLSEQVEVGSVAKTIGEGSEEPADDEVLGFMSAVNMQVHRTKLFAQEMRASMLKRCPDVAARDELAKRLDDARTGLVVSERLVNLPAALVPSLVDSLLQDIAWAAAEAEEAATRDALNFSQLLLVASVTLKAGGPGAGSSSGAGSSGGPLDAGAGKKKKKREREAAAASAHAALLEAVDFMRPEEEILAGAAEWQALLNGPGKSRQMVLAFTPEAARQALPALHAAMGEDV